MVDPTQPLKTTAANGNHDPGRGPQGRTKALGGPNGHEQIRSARCIERISGPIVTLSLNCLKNNTREASTRGHRPRGHRPHRPRGRTCARRPTHDPLTHPYAAKKGSTGSGQVQVSTGANWTWIFGVRFWCFFPRWLSFFPIEGSFFLSLSFVFFDVIF